MADATRGGANQHIRPEMKPARPSFSDDMRILNRLNDQAAEKYDGRSSHRMAITPKPEHGLVSIMGPSGLYYANAVGAFGVVAAGRNWGRLASAAHIWALILVEDNEFPDYYSRMAP